MKIIDSVEIHRFRSISDQSLVTDNLTIFSGVNNSGKSNVLRALNLFFNGETSYGNPFSFEKDYNHAYTGQAGGKRIIKITLRFHGQGDAALKEPFSISRSFEQAGVGGYTFNSTNKEVQRRLDRDDGHIKRQFTRFLNKIEYFYIPAVRDKQFVQSLFLNFEQLIDSDKGDDFEGRINDLSEILVQKSQDISRDFQKFIELPTEAVLSSRKTDILGAVEVNVDSGIEVLRRVKKVTRPEKVKVNLFSSGDGILMSYLAYFIAHICKRLPNKRFIWGFEEPENSLEYSKTQKLASDFIDKFMDNAQIFITTHSPAFISLKDESGCILHRVYVKPNDRKRSTEIRTLENLEKLQQTLFRTSAFSSEYKAVERELGLVELATEIEDTLDSLVKKKIELKQRQDEFDKQYSSVLASRPHKIMICEDSSAESIALWKELLKKYNIPDVKIISSNGSTGNFVENGIIYQKTFFPEYSPHVLRQVDRDGMTDPQVAAIERYLVKKYENRFHYTFMPLPVGELENFALLTGNLIDDTVWTNFEREIVRDFELTADALLKKFDREFDYEDNGLFRQGNSTMIPLQKMREMACSDWRRYMPGKTVCKRVPNFRPLALLKDMPLQDHPAELSNYMLSIKNFFAN